MEALKKQIIDTETKSQLLKVLKKANVHLLLEIKKVFDDEYYNGAGIISDSQYDIFFDYINDIQEISEDDEKTGKRDKAKLPIKMDSLSKIKEGEEKKIENWSKKFKGPYCIMPKLDGISCLLEFVNGKLKIYTKGSRSTGYGSDITDISKSIKFPQVNEDCFIRGELIMNDKLFSDMYADDFKNARTLVSGAIMSRDTAIEVLQDVDFIAYEIYEPNKKLENKNIQLEKLKKLKFTTVPYEIVNKIDDSILKKILLQTKKDFGYYIDGIVISDTSKEYKRNDKDATPDYAFAYKMLTETKEAIVEFVEWAISRHGLLKPRVRIIPLELSGITITYLTGHNGRFIQNNKIGKGAKILITRSGDVIPKILKVIQEAPVADMPSVKYYWNENGVECLAENSSIEQCISNIVHFFKTMNVEYLGEQTIIRIYEAGFTSLQKILKAKLEDFKKIDRFGDILANKIYENIHTSLKNASLAKLLNASGILKDIGEKRLSLVLENIPDIFTNNYTEKELLDKIGNIVGFSTILSEKVVENYKYCKAFLEMLINENVVDKSILDVKKEKVNVNGKFVGKKIVFTGFRDSELENEIKKMGGSVSTSVSKNTYLVVAKDEDESSSKITKAKELGIEVISLEKFKKQI